jgi:hypothetical protein
MLQRETQRLAYGDVAYYYRPPNPDENLDEFGHPTEVIKGVRLECSFNPASAKSREQWTEQIEVAKFDVEIRFGPDEITPKKGGQFKLTTKFDNPEFADQTYEVIGIQDRGNLGYLCALHRVEI